MMKIFLFILIIYRVELLVCNGSLTIADQNTVTVGDNDYVALENCDNPIVEEFGIPCDEIFELQGNLYTLIPINPRTLDYLNQDRAVYVLDSLQLYDSHREYSEEERIIGHEKVPTYERMSTKCVHIEEIEQRLYKHHPYYMLTDLAELRAHEEYTLDSVIRPVKVMHNKSQLELFQNMKKSFVFLNYIFSVLKDISGITDYETKKQDQQQDKCDYLQNYQQMKLIYLKDRLQKIQMQVSSNAELRNQQELKQQDIDIQNHLLQIKSKKNVNIKRERILDDDSTQSELSEETINNNKRLYVKQSLQITKDNCSDFFIENPIFIPSISLTDFALVVKNQQQKLPNFEELYTIEFSLKDSIVKNYFKEFEPEQLIEYMKLSFHAIPEFLQDTETFDKYQSDENIQILKNIDRKEQPENHRYIFFLIEFYRLFEEFVQRYLFPDTDLNQCFQNYSPDMHTNNCPRFMEELIKLFNDHEKRSLGTFMNLNSLNVQEDPFKIILDLEIFMEKAIQYSELYSNESNSVFDNQTGENFDLDGIQQEAKLNDISFTLRQSQLATTILPMTKKAENNLKNKNNIPLFVQFNLEKILFKF